MSFYKDPGNLDVQNVHSDGAKMAYKGDCRECWECSAHFQAPYNEPCVYCTHRILNWEEIRQLPKYKTI